MRYFTSVLFFLLIGTQSYSQSLSRPSATAYNPFIDRYYVVNYGNKSVVNLDRFGNKKLFTNSNLIAPSNILFAETAMGHAVLVLDSLSFKVFDTTGVFLGNLPISGAKHLVDAVYDDSTATFYTTDIEKGVVFKTTLGPGPYYLPSTSILASGIFRPTAIILQKKKKQLWLVKDTAMTDLVGVNLTSGALSIVRNTGLNNVWGLAQDGQGNLYLASQGDKNIYQWNKYLAGAPRKLVGEPKPGDITVNIAKDEWVYCCILCGTVYISKLHTFGPAIEVETCAGDTIEVYRNSLIKQVGTFDINNQFVLEMSSPWGNFDSSLILGVYSDTLVPESVKVKVPSKSIYSLGYKYRYRSISPSINGLAERMYVYELPALEWKGTAMYYCPQDSLHVLRKTFDWDKNYWYLNGVLLDSNEEHVHIVDPEMGKLKLDLISAYGCKSVDSAIVGQYEVIKPLLSYRASDSVVKSSEMGLEYTWYTPTGTYPTDVPYYKTITSGNYVLCMRTFEGCKVCSDTFNFQITGYRDYKTSFSIRLYPNPSHQQVQIIGMPPSAKVRVLNLQGQLINCSIVEDRIDVSTLQSGQYLVEIYSTNGLNYFMELIVQK